MSDANSLNDETRGFLKEMVEAQRSGKYQRVMGYALARGRMVWVKAEESGEEEAICLGIAKEQLRALDAAGLLSVSTPRSHWRLRLRPAAFEAVNA